MTVATATQGTSNSTAITDPTDKLTTQSDKVGQKVTGTIYVEKGQQTCNHLELLNLPPPNPSGENQCIPNMKPYGDCVCAPWGDFPDDMENFATEPDPTAACCMSPSKDFKGYAGWCRCKEGTSGGWILLNWRRCKRNDVAPTPAPDAPSEFTTEAEATAACDSATVLATRRGEELAEIYHDTHRLNSNPCGGVQQTASKTWKLCALDKPKGTKIEYLQHGKRLCLTVDKLPSDPPNPIVPQTKDQCGSTQALAAAPSRTGHTTDRPTSAPTNPPAIYIKVKDHHECNSDDKDLTAGRGRRRSLANCAQKVKDEGGKYFIYGKDSKADQCFWELTDSEDCRDSNGESDWENDDYNFYKILDKSEMEVPQRNTDGDKDLFDVKTLQSSWCRDHNKKTGAKRTLSKCKVTYNGNAKFIKQVGDEWTNAEFAQFQTAMFRGVSAKECHPPGHPDEIYQIFQSPDVETVCGIDSKQPKPNEIVWGGYDGMCLASCGVSASGGSFCRSGGVVVVPCGTSVEARAETDMDPKNNFQSKGAWHRRRSSTSGMLEYGSGVLYYPVLDTSWSKRTLTVLPSSLLADSADSYLFRENLIASWSISKTRKGAHGVIGMNTGPLRYPKGLKEDSGGSRERNYKEPMHPEGIFGNNPQALTIDPQSGKVKLEKVSKGNIDSSSPGYQNFKHTGWPFDPLIR